MIRYARKEDAPRILQLIKDLAEYEKAPLEAKATLKQIEETIFGDNPVAYCHVAEYNCLIVGISI
jgi:N-acetylglutamate synthase-like GNAT family acetyltransferase